MQLVQLQRKWLAWRWWCKSVLAGDLESSDFAISQTGHLCSLECLRPTGSPEARPLELIWKVAESNSHLMSRAPCMPSLMGWASWCQSSAPQRASSHQHHLGRLQDACRDADRGLHPIPWTRIPGGGARTSGVFSSSPGDSSLRITAFWAHSGIINSSP